MPEIEKKKINKSNLSTFYKAKILNLNSFYLNIFKEQIPTPTDTLIAFKVVILR